MVSFCDFINEDTNQIQKRFKLLLLNSYLYKQFINEKFVETKEFYSGKKGLESKYKLMFDKGMKSSSIKGLEDFKTLNIENLLKLHLDYTEVDLMKLDDTKFIEYLDEFLEKVYRLLKTKIYEINDVETKYSYDNFVKVISIDTLKRLVKDYINFRNTIISILSKDVDTVYASILGNDVKRIQRSKKFDDIKVDYDSLEESGVDIL
jgi:hypothetical protein